MAIPSACSTSGSTYENRRTTKKYVVNVYVDGFRGLINVDKIDAEKLTHINYAFVNVKDSMAVLTNQKTDTVNFRKLNTLKKVNPDLKILISIGGWAWSENFSDAVLTPSSRTSFARSAVNIVRKYKLDGIDIDWEYPGKPGEEGNVYRPEDMQNYTLMFRALRQELNTLTLETGHQYQLTTAVGGSQSFIKHTQMAQVQQYLDYIWLMTYDYAGPNGTVGHHTNLYSYNKDGSSADQTVKHYISAGVPASKLSLGAAFYGKARKAASVKNNGLGQKQINNGASVKGGGYTFLRDSLEIKKDIPVTGMKKRRLPTCLIPKVKCL